MVTVVSVPGFLCKGSFRTSMARLGELAIPTDAEGFGATCYTRTMAIDCILFIGFDASCNSTSEPHRDGEDLFLA